MNLLIDSGNSFIKWALAKDGALRLESQCLSSSASSLYEIWSSYEIPARVIVANVAGDRVAGEISKAVKVLWQLEPEYVESRQHCCGLENSYHAPGQLGVDRWLAMIAAQQMVNGPAIILDCGTAITIDLVNEKGAFAGGVIMPGLNMAFRSLSANTDALDEIGSIHKNISPVAQTTDDGVIAGVMLGIVGGIEKVVKEQAALVKDTATVIMTGGDAEKLLPHLSVMVVIQPDLVLQGLQIVASLPVKA